MIPLQLLALAALLTTESPAPAVDPIAAMIRDMPPPDWLQKELRGAPPTTMAPTGTTIYAPPPPQTRSYVQGLIGVTELKVKDLGIDSGLGSFVDQDDAEMPLLGGAVQRVLKGDKLHLGVEGGFLMGWMGNVEAVVVGPGGGAAIVADNDVFMMETFAGLYADVMLGDKLRLYAGAGGLLDWAHMYVDYTPPLGGYVHASGDGFGFGLYTRLGFDIPLQSGMRLGFCWRWFESDLDMGGGLDDLEIEGMQYMLTFTRSM